MTRRLWLCAILLALALPTFAARRRAVTPGQPGHCVLTTLLPFSYAQLLTVDEQFVYLVDESGGIMRVPKLGGESEFLVFSLGDWLPLSMTVDATNIYLGVLPFEALFTKVPGAILTVPKTGGVPTILVDEVSGPFAIATDATHLYWVSTGTIDFSAQRIDSDGKIERALKDGSSRQALAQDLSGPLALALDANSVFFGETGIADDDPTVGLYRVAKSGDAITTVDDDTIVIGLAVDGNTIVLFGGSELEGGGVLAIDKEGATPMRTLYMDDETIGGALHIADRRAYFLRDTEEWAELVWVSIDAPNGAVVARGELEFSDEFALDGCAAIVNTIEGQLIRTKR